MPSVTRVPLCAVSFCPDPSNPDHACIICGALAVEHHHVIPRGMGGSPSRKKDKRNVVLLCHKHHERVTTGNWGDGILELPTGRLYRVWDQHNKTVFEKELGGTDGASDLLDDSVRPDRTDDRSEPSSVVDTGRPGRPGTRGRRVGRVPEVPAGTTSEAGLSWDRWIEMGQSLNETRKNFPWAAGDWALLGEEVFGEKAWQSISDLGKNINNYMWVAREFPPTARVEGLTWTHHRYAAKLNADERHYWLRKALEENLSTGEMWGLLHADKPTVTWRCPECKYVGERNEFKEIT